LAMLRKLYPEKSYPQGHPYVASALRDLGELHALKGEYARALPLLERSLKMSQGLFEHFAAGASEAEALNHGSEASLAEQVYLSVTRQLDRGAGSAYARLWRNKASLARLLPRREEELAGAGPEARKLARALREKRQELARALLASADAPEFDPEKVSGLTDEKEALERKLAALLPGLRRRRQVDR